MSGTTTLITPVCQFTSAGIVVPSFATVLAWCQQQYQIIYGADLALDNSTPEGQECAIWAQSIADCNSVAAMVFNSFSPNNAEGAQLSLLVKINGLRRNVPSFSTIPVIISGTVNTSITNGYVRDDAGNIWNLPSNVVIPPSGTITVTATCATVGAIGVDSTPPTIGTPTNGWQVASWGGSASLGEPVESDPQLRQRQTVSTELPASTIADGTLGAILDLPNVNRATYAVNGTKVTDARGIPPNSIAFVVDGGDQTQIAQTIALNLTPGGGTYGTTSVTVVSQFGIPEVINFFRPQELLIDVIVNISLMGLTGYSSIIGQEISQAVANYINARPIGADGGELRLLRLTGPASLTPGNPYVPTTAGATDGNTYEVVGIYIAIDGTGAPIPLSIPIAFNQAVYSTPANVTVVPVS